MPPKLAGAFGAGGYICWPASADIGGQRPPNARMRMGFPRQGGCTEIERFHGPDSEKFEMPRDFSPFDERQIPQLIDDDQIVMQQFLGQAAAAAGGIFLLELIDQIEQVIEPSPGPGADDRRGDADAQMGFARAGSADEDCVALGVEESTGREFPHLALIDRGVGEHEAVEVLEHRELGGGDPVADRSGLPVCRSWRASRGA